MLEKRFVALVSKSCAKEGRWELEDGRWRLRELSLAEREVEEEGQ